MGATLPSGSDVQSLALEGVLSFILMFVTMAVATDVRVVGQAAAIAIGATVGLEAIFAGPISGASMNPARFVRSRAGRPSAFPYPPASAFRCLPCSAWRNRRVLPWTALRLCAIL